MKTLKDIKCGKRAVVKKINGDSAIKRRIMDMGITKGTTIYVKRIAPFGDPIELEVRGYELSIRKEDAKNILVE